MRIPVELPPDRGLDVVGLGENTVDLMCVVDVFPAPGEKRRLTASEVQPGGQVANVLVALQRWGARTAYVGAFGDDVAGVAARAALAAEGVDLSATVVRSGHPNQLSVILVERPSGERTVLWHRAPGLSVLAEDVPVERVEAARVLYVDGSGGEAAVMAATRARRAGVPVVADVDTPTANVERLLALVDVLIVPLDFARTLSGRSEPEAALAALGTVAGPVVGVTLGRGGAIVAAAGALVRVEPYPVTAVDTTGAGDLFHAGIVWGMLTGLELEPSLRLASAAAALQCERLGGRAALPTLAAARALAGL